MRKKNKRKKTQRWKECFICMFLFSTFLLKFLSGSNIITKGRLAHFLIYFKVEDVKIYYNLLCLPTTSFASSKTDSLRFSLNTSPPPTSCWELKRCQETRLQKIKSPVWVLRNISISSMLSVLNGAWEKTAVRGCYCVTWTVIDCLKGVAVF